jgi:hypothetical protein
VPLLASVRANLYSDGAEHGFLFTLIGDGLIAAPVEGSVTLIPRVVASDVLSVDVREIVEIFAS